MKASIGIAAPPDAVREKFLDFSKIPTYHPNGFFRSIGPLEANTPLKPGITMHNVLEIGEFKPTLLENSPTVFSWAGGMRGLFYGEHIFRFEASPTLENGTRFTQEEEFTGVLSFLMGTNFVARWVGMAEKTSSGFEAYNRDLKKWCEGGNEDAR